MRKLLAAGALALCLFLPSLALATAAQDYGLESTGTSAYGTVPTAARSDLTMFIGAYIIQPILGLVGLGFFIFTIYGGVMWMVAAGNADQVKKAQTILRNSATGTVIIVAAYAITNALLNALTSGNVSS